jgi:hypothetical protein
MSSFYMQKKAAFEDSFFSEIKTKHYSFTPSLELHCFHLMFNVKVLYQITDVKRSIFGMT